MPPTHPATKLRRIDGLWTVPTEKFRHGRKARPSCALAFRATPAGSGETATALRDDLEFENVPREGRSKLACIMQHFPVDECDAGKTLDRRLRSNATAKTVASLKGTHYICHERDKEVP